jgi:hypothetical protein
MLWIEQIVWPAHEAACERDSTDERPLDPLKEYSIVHMDAYPVHIERKFIDWTQHHPKYKQLLLIYVPANCTSVMQVGDVAYNRPFKAIFTREHMQHLTQNVQEQLAAGVEAKNIRFEKRVPSVQGRR